MAQSKDQREVAENLRVLHTRKSLLKATGDTEYGTVLIDPPWPSASKPSRGHWLTDNTKPRYRTMSERELMLLPVNDIVADDAMLVMWTTWMHLPLATDLMQEWRFNYVTGIPWLKTVQPDQPWRSAVDPKVMKALRNRIMKPIYGPGVWFQHCTELVLLGRRGRPFGKLGNPRPARPGIIISPRDEHSRKPEELQDWIDAKFPGPKIELFARRQRPGWTCWGDQL